MMKLKDDLEPQVYEAIGRFIFWFSKLEGMMKADLAGMLDLDNDYLDPVTSAFDFAQLCKVLAAIRKKDRERVDEFYNSCSSSTITLLRPTRKSFEFPAARHLNLKTALAPLMGRVRIFGRNIVLDGVFIFAYKYTTAC